MKYVTAYCAALTAVAVLAAQYAAFASRDVRRVKALEFRGLNYLGRGEVLAGVNAAVDNGDIVIEMDGLKNSLKKNPMVRAFQFDERDGRLAVIVIENEPAYLVALVQNGKTIPVELDEKFRVISAYRAHAYDKPILICNAEMMAGGKPSTRLIDLLCMLRDLKHRGLDVYREIAEIDATAYPVSVIRLRGRLTRFTMRLDRENLRTLNYMAGYCDERRRYPGDVQIYGERAVMK